MRLTTESALAVGALRPRKPAAMATAIVSRTVKRRVFIFPPPGASRTAYLCLPTVAQCEEE